MEKIYENINAMAFNKFVIGVKGKLDKSLSDILGGLSISHRIDNNNKMSYLEGEIIDQAELIGILNTLYNMRFPIISVKVI